MDALNNLFPETSVKKIHQFQAYFVHRNTSEIPFFNAQLKKKQLYFLVYILQYNFPTQQICSD